MAPKKKKSKKEIKAEKEALEAALAEERRLQEIEDEKERQRQAAIDAEKARIAAEEEKERRIVEDGRLKEEKAAYDTFYYGRQAKCKEVQEEIRKWSEWQRYLEKSELPAPDSKKEVNTFLSQWGEDDSEEVESLIDSMEVVEQVAKRMHKQLPEFLDENRANDHTWSTDFCKDLMRKITAKNVDTTSMLLQKIEDYADKDRVVMKTFKREQLTYTIWSNLNHGAKLPRHLELPGADITFDMPKLLSRAQFAIRIFQTYSDHLDLAETGDEKRAHGGMLTFDMFMLPPFARKSQNWNLRQIPAGFMDTAILNHTNLPVVEDEKAQLNAQATTVHVKFKVAPDVLMRESPTRVGWWDHHGKKWRTDGVENVQFDEVTREVSCETMVLSPIAVVQSRSLDIPYGKWTLNPTAFNVATLTLELKTHTLVLEINEHFAKLQQPELPELAGIFGVEMRPAALLAALSRAGFSVFPSDSDVAHVDTLVPKMTSVEKQLHECMSMNCQGYLYTGSVWNQAAGKEKCVVRLAEKPDVEIEPMLETYKSVIYMYERESIKTAVLDCEEHEASYKEKITELTHIRLEHVMDPTMPEMCRENIKNSSIQFQEAVRHTLDGLRLFSFS